MLTNPWLTYIAKETLLFRHFSFSEKSHPTITRILIPSRSNPSLEESSAQKRRLLTRTLNLERLKSIGDVFSPVHFQGLEPQ